MKRKGVCEYKFTTDQQSFPKLNVTRYQFIIMYIYVASIYGATESI